MRRQFCILVVGLLAVLSTTYASIYTPPRMINQPPSDKILIQIAQPERESDKPFIIECEAKGQPEPEYFWIKNGKNFSVTSSDTRIQQYIGSGTLVFTRPRDEDVGQYQCFAYNEFGVATSNSVFVRKAELNSFKDELPKTIEANEGEPFGLQCEAPDGWPKPTVNWLIQSISGGIKSIKNSRMTLDPEGTLWFTNVTRGDASDDFFYACSATSIFRNEYRIGNRISLNVKQTDISAGENKHPLQRQYVTRKSEVALRGKLVELFCIYGGTPIPQTIWTKDGKPIPRDNRILEGHYGKSLLIRNVTFEDGGTYTCDVSNGVGDAQSQSINLSIHAAPYFTREPEIQTVAEDEIAVFNCEAEGIPEPTIQWIHNGKPIELAPPNPRRVVETNQITIRDVHKSDTGNYGCNATNSLGYVYRDVYLNVLELPPEFELDLRNEFTVDGKNVTISCRVFGVPRPQIKWMRNTLEVTDDRFTTLANGDLEIRETILDDTGIYTCHAVNKFGSVSANASLVVMKHTKITQAPLNQEIYVGKSAAFHCNVEHDTDLDVQVEWQKDGIKIDFDHEPRFVQTKDNSLHIAGTIELDSGDYTCIVRTQFDEVSATANLIVLLEP